MDSQIISGLRSYLIFQLGNEKFAVNIGHVKKVLEMTEITKIPHTPDLYLGMINLSGDVIPVIDGRTKMGMKMKNVDPNTAIVIFMVPSGEEILTLGFVADQVLNVVDFSDENLSSPPDVGKRFQKDFIPYVARIKEEFILVLDIEKLFEGDKLDLVSMDI